MRRDVVLPTDFAYPNEPSAEATLEELLSWHAQRSANISEDILSDFGRKSREGRGPNDATAKELSVFYAEKAARFLERAGAAALQNGT